MVRGRCCYLLERKNKLERRDWGWTDVSHLLYESQGNIPVRDFSWRYDYIMAVLFWAAAERQNIELVHTLSQPAYKLIESPHSCNNGLWLVTATIIHFGFRVLNQCCLMIPFFTMEIRRTYTARIEYDKLINYNRKANGVIKACTGRCHVGHLVFGGPILKLKGKWVPYYYCRP